MDISEYKRRHKMVSVGSGQTVIDSRTGYKWIFGGRFQAFNDKGQLCTYFKLIEDIKTHPETRIESYDDFVDNYYIPDGK